MHLTPDQADRFRQDGVLPVGRVLSDEQVREARRRTDPSAPLHIVGFSNGGALALIHALDSLGDPKIARPDRLILISPMVGITSFARFAGLAALPAYLPAFAKAAEFNKPRWPSLREYAQIVGFNLEEAIQKINAAPKLY